MILLRGPGLKNYNRRRFVNNFGRPLGCFFRPFSQNFVNFLHLGAHLKPQCVFFAIFSEFLQFLVDFWWFWPPKTKPNRAFFCIFFDNVDFAKITTKHWLCAQDLRFELLKITLKTQKIHKKVDANLEKENNKPKIAQKSDLGWFWPPFGRGLGRSGACLGRSWALLGRFWGI